MLFLPNQSQLTDRQAQMSEKKRESDTLEGVHKKLKQEVDRMDGKSSHEHGIKMQHAYVLLQSRQGETDFKATS